jgi:hypothetical protein
MPISFWFTFSNLYIHQGTKVSYIDHHLHVHLKFS